MTRLSRNFRLGIISTFVIMLLSVSLACAGPSVALDPATPQTVKGKILVSYLYMAPSGEVEPSYHTVVWLADLKGKLLHTLYVSQELSTTEYKLDEACKTWVEQANWDKAEKSLVDAVTGPTPNVGEEAREFPLEGLGLTPGVYQFRFEVNVADGYDLTFLAKINLGGAADEPKTEMLYYPSKPSIDIDFVRDVKVQYIP
jgi:hypothetical protein